MKQFWLRWRQTKPDRASTGLSDAELLDSVRQSFHAEVQDIEQTSQDHELLRLKEAIALEAYLTGEASPEDVRAYVNCDQCAHILTFSRQLIRRVSSSAETSRPRSHRLWLKTRLLGWFAAYHNSSSSGARLNPKLVTIGAITCLITLTFLLIAAPWFSPTVSAILRFGEQPKPIEKEQGRLADKVRALLDEAQRVNYLPPSSQELKVIEETAELVTLSLKLNNNTLLAEASKAADHLGYALVEFEDVSGLGVIMLEEKPDHHRGWGSFLFRRDHYDGRLVIVAPHSLRDPATGWLAYECFSQIPAADAFFLSGTEGHDIDDAHTEHTPFNAVFRATMQPQAICLSLHGFDENKPGRSDYPDAVVSSGAITEPIVKQIHTTLRNKIAKVMRVGVYDGRRFADVSGTTNQQGIITSSVNSLFAELALNRGTRFDPVKRDRLVNALATVLGDVDPKVITRYTEPSRNTFIKFTTVKKVHTDLLIKHGHNSVFISPHQMKRLQLRSGDLALVSHGDQHAVTRVYPINTSDNQIFLTGAKRRQLGVGRGRFSLQISRLPE